MKVPITFLALAIAAVQAGASGPAMTTPPQSDRPHLVQGPPQDRRPATATCVFSNPSFSGKCTETASVPPDSTPEKACGEILSCLNDPMCARTFCQSTTIRGGWHLESVSTGR